MKKFLSLALALTCAVSLLAGCQKSGGDQPSGGSSAASNPPAASNTEVTGAVATDGSTSMEKVIGALGESFMGANKGITVTYNPTGSGSGIQAVSEGRCDIGLSSRALKDEEKASGLKETVVALDGIAIIVSPENPVSDLDVETIAKIYTGEITNWKDLGGADEEIAVYGREAGSGTRGAFEELLKIEDQCAYAQELDSTGGVLAKVAATPGSIGYVSLDVVDDTVTALSLNGVAPTEENIVAGSYTLSRPFVMATKGTIDAQSDAVKTWFSYVESDAGKAVITGLGLILPQ